MKSNNLYKNNAYKNGVLRSDIPHNVLYTMASKYGDVLHSISSTKWVSLDEIAKTYWHINQSRQKKNQRGMPGIKDAIHELVSSGLILQK